jgi:hypothetical protein
MFFSFFLLPEISFKFNNAKFSLLLFQLPRDEISPRDEKCLRRHFFFVIIFPENSKKESFQKKTST